ncbi:hypothetical protein BDV18DRAFT_141994 [Aspergillus unguis]
MCSSWRRGCGLGTRCPLVLGRVVGWIIGLCWRCLLSWWGRALVIHYVFNNKDTAVGLQI